MPGLMKRGLGLCALALMIASGAQAGEVRLAIPLARAGREDLALGKKHLRGERALHR